MAFIANLDSVIKEMKQKALKKTDGTVTKRYKALVRSMLYDLAMNTPQWSGDLAASWQVLVGVKNQIPSQVATPYKEEQYWDITEETRRFRGNPGPVGWTMDHNEGEINRIRWNSKVSIQNISPTIPQLDESRMRRGNFIPGDIMAIKYVQLKYNL